MIITIIICLAVGFIGGFYAGIKNAQSSKVNKAKEIVDLINK